MGDILYASKYKLKKGEEQSLLYHQKVGVREQHPSYPPLQAERQVNGSFGISSRNGDGTVICLAHRNIPLRTPSLWDLNSPLVQVRRGMNSTTQPCRAPQAYAVKLSRTLVLNMEKTVQKLQNENWTLKEGKSDMLHEKVINQKISRLK